MAGNTVHALGVAPAAALATTQRALRPAVALLARRSSSLLAPARRLDRRRVRAAVGAARAAGSVTRAAASKPVRYAPGCSVEWRGPLTTAVCPPPPPACAQERPSKAELQEALAAIRALRSPKVLSLIEKLVSAALHDEHDEEEAAAAERVAPKEAAAVKRARVAQLDPACEEWWTSRGYPSGPWTWDEFAKSETCERESVAAAHCQADEEWHDLGVYEVP